MPRHSPKMLLEGGCCTVPSDIAVCPECGGRLIAESTEWNIKTGTPTREGLYVFCKNDTARNYHKGLQSDWYPVHETVLNWANAADN